MVTKHFATLVYRSQYDKADRRKLIRELLNESITFADLDNVGNDWSAENYPFGYTSYSSHLMLEKQSPYFQQLEKWIFREVKKYGKLLKIDFDQGEIVLSNLWINIMEKGCQHSSHLHPLSTISGTFYLNTPRSSGDFVFEDPRMSHFMGSAPRIADSGEDRLVKISPKAGELILFESWLRHEVRTHQGEEPRVSISFNYDWKWK